MSAAYDRVKKARAPGRPTAVSYIANIFTDFVEMHGDRRYGDDHAMLAGIARLDGLPVTLIATEKGISTKDKIYHNFGCAHPEGYRKALRQMKLAEKFGRPIITLIDTSGAYCGVGAEERGQGQAIAENLSEMMALRTPIISIIIGEGGSGGALALAVADRVWMLENSIYSVISPEGCASILWKDSSKVEEASAHLKLTAGDLLSLGVVDAVFPEGENDFNTVYTDLKAALISAIGEERSLSPDLLLHKRYMKFRSIGALI